MWLAGLRRLVDIQSPAAKTAIFKLAQVVRDRGRLARTALAGQGIRRVDMGMCIDRYSPLSAVVAGRGLVATLNRKQRQGSYVHPASVL
jgi:hypothetical protein